MPKSDRAPLSRCLALGVLGGILLFISYLSVDAARTQAASTVDSDCIERTVDGGLFDLAGEGQSTLVCATEVRSSRAN